MLAGEAGVCAGGVGGSGMRGKKGRQLSGDAVDFIRSKSQTGYAPKLLTDGEVMSGGVDMSPKSSNWLMF